MITDFLKVKKIKTTSLSGTPTISRTLCIKIIDGDPLTTGTGKIVLDWSHIFSKKDIGVYDENNVLLRYYFESFDLTNKTTVIWIYNEWVCDGTIRLKIAYGEGLIDQSSVSSLVFNNENDIEAKYLFNESSGNLLDKTRGENNGTVYGALQDEEGIIDKSYYFDGNDDRIVTNYNGIGGHNESFTISFWLKSSDVVTTTGNHFIIANYGYDISRSGFYAIGTDDTSLGIFFWLRDVSNNSVKTGYHKPAFDGQWHHYLAIRNIAGDKLWFVIDGVLEEVLPTTNNNPVRDSDSYLEMMAHSTNFISGNLDNINIYRSVLVQDEITVFYDTEKETPSFFDQEAEEDTKAVYHSPGLQLRMYSLTNQQFNLLSPNIEGSSVLDLKINWKKIGGLNSFELIVARDVNFLLFSGIRIDFYFNGVLFFTGFTEYIPSPDQNSDTLKIQGKGFYKQLEDIVINETFTSEYLFDIIDYLCTTYFTALDISYVPAKIRVPEIIVSQIEFKDKNLFDVFDTLNNICNYDYANERHYFGIDESREFYFQVVKKTDSLIDQLFEGYNFQNPESKLDSSKLINKVMAYRTISGDDNEVQYVDTYSDNTSIDRYGEKVKKITFPDYIDTTTIQNIATGILELKKEPTKRFTLNDFVKQRKLDYGFYGLNARIKSYKREIYNGSSLDPWDTTGASVTTIEESEEIVFTGRRSLKVTTAVGSAGEYIELELEDPIWFPKDIEILLYMVDEIINIEIEVFDTEGNSTSFNYGQVLLNLDADDNGTQENLTALQSSGEDNLVALKLDTSDIFNQWLARKVPLEGLILNIDKIRITFNIDRASVLYIDRIITNYEYWWYNELELEEVEYSFNQNILSAKATLGDKADSLYDEIKNNTKDGNIAFDIFSKQ